jgi:hypothetical protein
MPQKVLIGFEEFKAFCARVYKQDGFKFVEYEERIAILNAYLNKLKNFVKETKKKKIPSGQEGLQTVLKYEYENFIIYVFTTFVWKTGEMKKSDEGWVFIIDKRKPKNVCFYSFPMRRTKNYLLNLEAYALAEKNRIDTMPCCDECKTVLTIKLVKGKGKLHQYTLDCPNFNYFHRKGTTKNFYTGMDSVHEAFLSDKFKRYQTYVDKNNALGIIHEPSRFIRAKKTSNSETTGIHLVKEYVDRIPEDDVPQYLRK